MKKPTAVKGLPNVKTRELSELEWDGYSPGGPLSGQKRPPHKITNLGEFEELLARHFGASKVSIDVTW